MKIKDLPLDRIIPYADNPRDNSGAVNAVAESIKSFGFNVPLVLDRDGVIITGHTRYKAATKLGLSTVPCIIAEGLSEDQARAYRLADNRVSELATWDKVLLSQELKALEEIGIDMTDFGFSDELDEMTADDIEEDTPPEDAEPVTKPGDVFQLGRHRLLCGDATDSEAVRTLVRDEKMDLLLTDPPYNVDYTGATAAQMKIKNDSMNSAEFYKFLQSAFASADTALKPGAAFYVWHAPGENAAIFYDVLKNFEPWKIKQSLVWIKNLIVLGHSDYQYRHEPCIYGVKTGAAHYFADTRSENTVIEDRPDLAGMSKDELRALCKELLDREPCQTSILREDKPAASHQHPTMKPVKLFARLILNSTKKPGKILDVFAGSGTTAIAAEQLGRSAYMIELSPLYCDRIIRRYESMTGEKAIRL